MGGGFSFGKMSEGYDEIKELQKNLPANVRFIGIVPRSEMNDIYNISDVVFLPSYSELFPMTILEALSTKTPILLRDNVEYKNILNDSYLKGNSVDEFSDIIKKLSSNKEFHKTWSEKSFECSKLYNEENILKQWDKLYTSSLLKKKSKSLNREDFK